MAATCIDCGVIKTANNTNKDVSAPGGLYSVCSECALVRRKTRYADRYRAYWEGRKKGKVARKCCVCGADFISSKMRATCGSRDCVRLYTVAGRYSTAPACKNPLCSNRTRGKGGYCRHCMVENNAKTKKKKWEPKVCIGCGRPMQNRGNYYDYCSICYPVVFCKINYCRYCGCVIRGKRSHCVACDSIDKNERKGRHTKSVREFKNSLRAGGCVVCGYKKCINALDFHHTNEKKANSVSRLRTITKVKAELKYGDLIVVCSNCHREIHSGIIDLKSLKINPIIVPQDMHSIESGIDA